MREGQRERKRIEEKKERTKKRLWKETEKEKWVRKKEIKQKVCGQVKERVRGVQFEGEKEGKQASESVREKSSNRKGAKSGCIACLEDEIM